MSILSGPGGGLWSSFLGQCECVVGTRTKVGRTASAVAADGYRDAVLFLHYCGVFGVAITRFDIPGCTLVWYCLRVLSGLVVTRSCGWGSLQFSQLARFSVAAVSPCLANKQKKGDVLVGAIKDKNEGVPGCQSPADELRKESVSKVTMPGGDRFVWASRPSCTLATGRRHDFREGLKLGRQRCAETF
jgi:hypothetical protein